MTSAPNTRETPRDGNRSQSTGAAVSIDAITVAYPQADGTVVDAVRAATIEIEAGSMVALLGPSGCGKTSLLRAIAGLERPTAGTLGIGGRVVSSTSTRGGGIWVHPERRSVGMVFQDGALFPHLTVAQNIAFGLRSGRGRGTRSGIAARVQEMLALVDLVDFADRLPGTLSGGQQQRVALARSLAPQPSVLLLDEPFSALDASLRAQVRTEVANIVREVGVTTIFVTHDQDEAFVLGDQVAVLRDGQIKQVGSPDVLYRHPETPWIAGFVGEANFLDGSVDITAPGHAVTALGNVPITHPKQIVDAADLDVAVDVRVLVRPEQVVITAAPPPEGIHRGAATITALEYYGHDVRYEVTLEGGSRLAARTQSPELFSEGQRVYARFEGHPTEAWPANA